jgi:hypothetical protein
MGILGGQLTAQRFRVDGKIPEGFRDTYREQLNEHAFRDPPSQGKEEVEGWVHLDEMMNTDFHNFNRWLIGSYVVIALRIDVIRLPAKRFKAELRRQCQEWATENGTKRCPPSIKKALREELENAWTRRTMPTSRVVGLAWNLDTGMVYIESPSDGICDRIRKRFYRTFGLRMYHFSPLDWLDDASQEVMIGTPPSIQFGTGRSNG